MTDYIPTQSHTIEFELIGSILKDGRIFPRIADIVNKDTFHSTVCSDIFFAMSTLFENGMVIDAITVGDQLQRDGCLETIITKTFSGRAALSRIRDEGNPKNAESYALSVQDYWGKRFIDAMLPKLSYWARNGRRSIDILADARTEFDKIDVIMGTMSANTVNSKTAASRSWDETEKASKGQIKYAKLGFLDLDRFFRMRHGNLSLLAGRPGDGKTAMLITIALNNANEGRKVLFFSLEMTMEEITARFLSQISDVPATRIMDGSMTGDEWDRHNKAIEIFEKLPIIINDTPAITLSQFAQEARRVLKPDEDSIVIVDYIQLMHSGQNKQSRVDEVGIISRDLKKYAKSLPGRPPILAAAQLSRAVEMRKEKRPILSDLRESGSLEQDSDNIVFIYNPSDIDTEYKTREIIVSKQRNGAKGTCELRFNAPTMKFQD
jgi:replicative DNA helicase